VIIPTSAVGAQQQELERVKAALERDGLFDIARKRPLPAFARCVAVVTSLDGAALRDVTIVIRRRWPCSRLIVVGARVQGDGAEAELVRALGVVNRLTGVDVCIVGRGGGAREDLAVFNSEAVCRALAAVRVPTISAVGHETDVALTDFVADLRAAPPSAAAEAAVPDLRDVERQVRSLASRLASGLSRRTSLAAERLERPADRLPAANGQPIDRRRNRLDRSAAQLDALSPLRVLARGYAMPTAPDGRVLKRRADFPPGERFDLRVSDGSIAARVEDAE
jgi:exodeoxyribonuclease VII large subunit